MLHVPPRLPFMDTACILRGKVTVSVRLSVSLSHLAPQPRRAAGLLLWVPQADDID